MTDKKTYTGMSAYTSRSQRDGMVKVFFRDQAGKRAAWVIMDALAAKRIPRNRPLTIETSPSSATVAL